MSLLLAAPGCLGLFVVVIDFVLNSYLESYDFLAPGLKPLEQNILLLHTICHVFKPLEQNMSRRGLFTQASMHMCVGVCKICVCRAACARKHAYICAVACATCACAGPLWHANAHTYVHLHVQAFILTLEVVFSNLNEFIIKMSIVFQPVHFLLFRCACMCTTAKCAGAARLVHASVHAYVRWHVRDMRV